jgi:hypothetical protein
LRKGFRGRYQFRRVKISRSAERYHNEPEKNDTLARTTPFSTLQRSLWRFDL